MISETQTLDLLISPLEDWLLDETDCAIVDNWREKRTIWGTRVDALVVGMNEDFETMTISVEAKSIKTIHQIATQYSSGSHAIDSVMFGAFGTLLFGKNMGGHLV